MHLQLLLTVGAKLEHIITRLALEVGQTGDSTVKPSDGHFWFSKPGFVLYLIHFILFQNSFEIAFFFWILVSKLGCIFSKMLGLHIDFILVSTVHIWLQLMHHGRSGLHCHQTCCWVMLRGLFSCRVLWCWFGHPDSWLLLRIGFSGKCHVGLEKPLKWIYFKGVDQHITLPSQIQHTAPTLVQCQHCHSPPSKSNHSYDCP